MRLDRSKVKSVLAELAARDENKKGEQPELIMGCFYTTGDEDDDACKECPRYEMMCRNYLKAFEARKERGK